MRVVVLSNDVVPGMGLPVAAPGLRAWGTALGLREHGHDVTVVVSTHLANRAWRGMDRAVPVPQPRGTILLRRSGLRRYLREQNIDAVIATNSNHAETLEDIGDCRLVYDFFAPKMLELAEEPPSPERDEQLAELEQRKLDTLRRSHAVVVNGAKKLDYVRSWLDRAGRGDLTPRVMTMALPPFLLPRPARHEPVHAIVTGYLQPWSRPGEWVRAIRPFLDDGSMRLHVLIGSHWGRVGSGALELPASLAALADHSSVVTHRPMRFGDFRTLLARCDLSIDVFERNPERELAMVTRSAVALSCGLPVMHVPFTEVSPIIADHDGGWLVGADDVDAQRAIFAKVVENPDELEEKRRGAASAARNEFEPVRATRGLHELLEELG